MSRSRPIVSVIVPALNEERDIAGCIASLAAQTFPMEHVEVVLVDGGSIDATVERAREAAEHHGLSLCVLSNPQRIQSAALNVGLAAAAGEILVRVDARSIPAPNHVARCVEVLRARSDVGAVGGAQVAHARSTKLIDRAIARALNNRYAMGLARYRRRAASGATDTVWMGAFRTDDLRAIGGWDASFVKNEDFELNERVRKSGLVVWFDDAICSRYLPRTSGRAVARQYFDYGKTKGAMWATGWRPTPRQVVLLAAPPLAVGLVGACASSVGWVPVAIASIVGAAAADAVGNRGVPASPAERASAVIVNGVVGGSWWLGVVCGWAARSQSRPAKRSTAASAAPNVAAAPRSARTYAELTPSRR